MKVELLFKPTSKNKWYCCGILFFLLFANQTFGQTTRYVSASSGNDSGDCTQSSSPCSTILYAIGQASSGDEIEIANGIYATGEIYTGKSLSLIGESTTGTIIQAAEEPTNPNTGGTPVIYILSDADFSISNVHIRHGGGMLGGGIVSHSDLTLSSVLISNNSAMLQGGGLSLIGSITATLTDVTFLNNNCVGGTCFGGGMATGGDGENNFPTTFLTNVNFIGNSSNQGGGLQLFESTHTLKNVKFINNTSTGVGGGLSTYGATIDLTNVIFAGNTAQTWGGGIFAYDANSTLRNVSLSENSAATGGGIANMELSQNVELNMINSIVWGNSASQGKQFYNCDECAVEGYNNLYSNTSGDNIFGDEFNLEDSLFGNPLFLNPVDGNLGLAENSPAIDAGYFSTDLSYFPGGPTFPIDINGNPRVYNNRIDIGAYEYQGSEECEAPGSFFLEEVTESTASFSWNVSPSEVNGYNWFVMSVGDSPDMDDPVASGSTLSWMTWATATDLTPNTMYHVYLQSSCNGGEQSDYAGPFLVTTTGSGGGECEAPGSFFLEEVTESTASFSWNVSPSEVNGYNWFVMSVGDSPDMDDPVASGSTLSWMTWATATDLTPDTMYHVYLQSSCNGGEQSDYTGPFLVTTTGGGGECIQPSDIAVNTVTDSVVFVSWSENGSATQWEIEYGESGFAQGEGTTIFDNDGSPNETIDGLSQGVEYDVYVRAICEFSESEWTGPVTFVIEPEPCSQPTNVVVDVITPSMVYVTWTENGGATQWEIEYGETGFTQGTGTTITDNDGMPGEAISGLQEGINYDVYVRAICEFSESEWVGPVTFNTEEMGTSEFENQMILYPNPTTGIVNIQTKELIKSVSVYNLAGQRMSIKSIKKENTSIDISNLSSGVYFVEVILNDKTIKRYKVIKK